MAQIALVVAATGPERARVVGLIRAYGGLALGQVLASIQERTPVALLQMQGLDLHERSGKFSTLVKDLVGAGADVEMFEIMEHEGRSRLPKEALRVSLKSIQMRVAAIERERRYPGRTDSEDD